MIANSLLNTFYLFQRFWVSNSEIIISTELQFIIYYLFII